MAFSEPTSTAQNAAVQDDRARFRRNIPVFYVFNFAAGFFIWLPIWILYLLETRGLSLTQVALMEGVFWITVIITEVPTGAIADRFGRRISLALGGFGFTIASIVFALADTFAILLVSYLLMATALTLFTGSGPALVFDTLRHLRRTREFERVLGRSEAVMAFSLLTATLLGGPLAFLLGYQGVILVGAGTMSLGGLIALALREPPSTEARIAAARAEPGDAAAAAPAAPASYLAGLIAGIGLVLRTRPVLFIIPLTALGWVIFEMPEFLFQYFLFLNDIRPTASLLDGFFFSLYFVPIFVGSMAGSIIAAPISERFGERGALPIVLVAGGLVYLALALFDHLAVIAAITVVAAARNALRPIAFGYINRRVGSDQRATVLSVFELVAGGSMAAIVLIVGPSAEALNLQIAYAIGLAILAVGGAGLWLLWRRAHNAEPPPPDMDDEEAPSYIPVPIEPAAADPPRPAAQPGAWFIARPSSQQPSAGAAAPAQAMIPASRNSAASDSPIPIPASSASES